MMELFLLAGCAYTPFCKELVASGNAQQLVTLFAKGEFPVRQRQKMLLM